MELQREKSTFTVIFSLVFREELVWFILKLTGRNARGRGVYLSRNAKLPENRVSARVLGQCGVAFLSEMCRNDLICFSGIMDSQFSGL